MKKKVRKDLNYPLPKKEKNWLNNLVLKVQKIEKITGPKEIKVQFDKVISPLKEQFKLGQLNLSAMRPKQIHKFRLIIKRLRYQGAIQNLLFRSNHFNLKKMEMAQSQTGKICNDIAMQRNLSLYLKERRPNDIQNIKAIQNKILVNRKRNMLTASKMLKAVIWKS
jgi:CHAD domain-containing protein